MKLERVAPTQTDEQSAHSGSETPVTSPMSNEEPTIRVSNDRHSPNKALVDSKSQSLAPPPPHGSHEFAMEIDGELDEEADLRQWTHAREYQGQFAQAGGDFLAEL